MDLKLFNELMSEGSPEQHPSEWQMFLEICEMYLRKHGIKNPVVVELGLWANKQKKFYEQLLGAEHISVDMKKRQHPDIRGNTHDRKTLEVLKERLNGKSINILFIDACHDYESIKKDFEMYSPLCSDVIVIHDLKLRRSGVGKFWDELKTKHKDFLFLSIYQYRESKIQMGIGMITKR